MSVDDEPPSSNVHVKLSHCADGTQPRGKMRKLTVSPGAIGGLVPKPIAILMLSGALEQAGLSMCCPGRLTGVLPMPFVAVTLTL